METGESHTNNAFNQRFRDLVTDAGKHYRMLNTIGALIVRIGFLGPLYYSYNKQPPK